MKIFDIHTHVYPDKIAPSVVEYLQKKSNNLPAYTNGTTADLEKKAFSAGITGLMNCPVITNLKQMESVNKWCATLNTWPHLSLGGIFPDAENKPRAIEKIQQMGLCGLKFHPEYQEFNPLEERMRPAWEYCSANNFPVLFHAGPDVGFPGQRHSSPKDFAELARRYPKLTIICAHLGGWLVWDEVERDLAGAPVYFDTAFAAQWLKDEPNQFERIIRKHGVDRVLFGTDSPWTEHTAAIKDISSLTLSDDDKKKIFWDNADRIFGLSHYIK